MEKARIGLFGGSFNPVHQGHINMAKYALKELKLDELIFIPCYRSVDKTEEEYAPAHHRVAMLLKVLPENCSISTFELDLGTAVETIETLRYFKSIYHEAELFFIMGMDSFETIETWQEYEKLDEYAHIVVFKRNSCNIKESKGLKIKKINNELWNYSSNLIRNQNKISGVDLKVEIYIRENKLYGYVG